ncbi:MAG: hypothetical protein ACOYME_01840 [Prochlorotrichaceae cyanobacterium]|jgi:hypothetical protein
MLYLARVHFNVSPAGAILKLLAQKRSDLIWDIITNEDTLQLSTIPPELGSLVLVEVNNDLVVRIEDATQWVIELVQTYLTVGITPEFLQQEADRAEHWRQDLTLQSQELERRTLELEAKICQS